MRTLSFRLNLFRAVAAGAVALLMLTGCATANRTVMRNTLINRAGSAADELARTLEKPIVPGAGSIIAASLVNVDDMQASSSFGRIVSEQIASALASAPYNFPVTEVKLRQSVFLKQQAGEFLLSREIVNVSKKHEAQAVLVGTYAVGHKSVFVSVRMVDPQTNMIVSSSDFTVPLDNNIRTLLGYRRIHRASWWERLWGDTDAWSKTDRGYYEFFPDYL